MDEHDIVSTQDPVRELAPEDDDGLHPDAMSGGAFEVVMQLLGTVSHRRDEAFEPLASRELSRLEQQHTRLADQDMFDRPLDVELDVMHDVPAVGAQRIDDARGSARDIGSLVEVVLLSSRAPRPDPSPAGTPQEREPARSAPFHRLEHPQEVGKTATHLKSGDVA